MKTHFAVISKKPINITCFGYFLATYFEPGILKVKKSTFNTLLNFLT